MLEGVVSLKDLKIYFNISSSLLSLSLSLYRADKASITQQYLLCAVKFTKRSLVVHSSYCLPLTM